MNKLGRKFLDNWIIWSLWIVYAISLLPIFLLGLYTFPQADDWEFSSKTHIAWESTHSIFSVLAAAFDTVSEYYFDWQGTFFSIALMSLQPSIWKIEWYHIVPVILVGLLTVAVFMLFHSIASLVNSKGHEWKILSLITLILLIQRMHSSVNAFYWYNGACHYIVCTVVYIMLVASVLHIFSGRKPKVYCTLGCLLAFCLGGGNMITGLVGCISCMAGLIFVLLTKKHRGYCIPIFLLNFIGFAINLLAPGNGERQGYTGETMNPVAAVAKSFYHGLQYGFGKWFDWFFIIFIVVVAMIAFQMTRKTDFSYPLPGFFAGFSFCLYSAMFTPMEYAMQTVDVGRCLNAVYVVFVLLVSVNIVYFVGWIQSKGLIHYESIASIQNVRYWFCCWVFVVIFLCGIVSITERDYFTSELAVREIVNGKAESVASVVRENIEILQSDEKDVYLHQVPHTSQLLTSDDIDRWYFGTRLFFEKNTVTILEE